MLHLKLHNDGKEPKAIKGVCSRKHSWRASGAQTHTTAGFTVTCWCLLLPKCSILEFRSWVWARPRLGWSHYSVTLCLHNVRAGLSRARVNFILLSAEKGNLSPHISESFKRKASATHIHWHSPGLVCWCKNIPVCPSAEEEASNCLGICLENRFLCLGAQLCAAVSPAVSRRDQDVFALYNRSRILSLGSLQS